MATLINPYKDVHKGIRKLLNDTLLLMGQTDFNDAEFVTNLRHQVTQLHDLLELHSDIENRLLAPVIYEAGGESEIALIESTHERLDGILTGLISDLENLLPSDDSAARGYQLYVAYSDYVGEQMQHMREEETLIWPIISSQCSDQQMIEFQIQARQMTPPPVMRTLLMAMIAAINPFERKLMLGNMQKVLTAEAFQNICNLAQSVLSKSDWHHLSQQLGFASADLQGTRALN